MNLLYFQPIRVSVAGAMALLAVSCAASRSRTHSAEQNDAMRRTETGFIAGACDRAVREEFVREERAERFEAVPAGEAVVEVPLAALDSLPEGARFGARDGRVEVIAVRRGDKLVVGARSDSVARAVVRTVRSEALRCSDSSWMQVAESRAAESSTRESSATETSARRRPAGAWWLAAGFVLCAALFIRRRR